MMKSLILASMMIVLAQISVPSEARQVCTEINDDILGQVTHLADGAILFENPKIQYGSQQLAIQGDVGMSLFTGLNGKAFCRLSKLELVKAESDMLIFDKEQVITLTSSGEIAGTVEGSFALSRVLCRPARN